MAVQHVNRRGDTYILQQGKSRSGKPNYYFGRKVTGTPLDEIPQGFEIHEDPEGGQVFLRREKPSPITRAERDMAAAVLREYANVPCRIDVERKYLVVYARDTVRSVAADFMTEMGVPAGVWRDTLERSAPYTKMLRFKLVDEQDRLFEAQRWCFLGSIDNWMPLLARPTPLVALIRECAPHLDKESFFELM